MAKRIQRRQLRRRYEHGRRHETERSYEAGAEDAAGNAENAGGAGRQNILPLRRAAALSRRRSTASASSSRSRSTPRPSIRRCGNAAGYGHRGGQFRAQGGGDLPRGEHSEGHRQAELRL